MALLSMLKKGSIPQSPSLLSFETGKSTVHGSTRCSCKTLTKVKVPIGHRYRAITDLGAERYRLMTDLGWFCWAH